LTSDHLLKLDDIRKDFELAGQTLPVLTGISLGLAAGESLSIMGPSGSGKSTLLHLIGTLDAPTSGRVRIQERDPFALSEPELARFRNRTIGFVFQDHYLLPQYSVLENVLLPTRAFADGGDQSSKARDLLARVGLENRLAHRPAELSGGERQRVAIARALINSPPLLLCDEPTGNLDQKTAATVADLLFDLHRQQRTVLVLVTHSAELAEKCSRRAQLQTGRLVED